MIHSERKPFSIPLTTAGKDHYLFFYITDSDALTPKEETETIKAKMGSVGAKYMLLHGGHLGGVGELTELR